MDPKSMLEKAQETMTTRSVYGEPYTQDGVTIVPVAAVRGGGGGGGDERENGGGGFGLSARPVGAYVIRDGVVEWKAAVDIQRIIIGGYLVAAAALLTLRSIAKTRR